MAVRSVRLDADAEELLEHLARRTGLSKSGVLKRGLLAVRDQMEEQPDRTPFEIYEQLDLGTGGFSTPAQTDLKSGIRAAIRRKLRR